MILESECPENTRGVSEVSALLWFPVSLTASVNRLHYPGFSAKNRQHWEHVD